MLCNNIAKFSLIVVHQWPLGYSKSLMGSPISISKGKCEHPGQDISLFFDVPLLLILSDVDSGNVESVRLSGLLEQ